MAQGSVYRDSIGRSDVYHNPYDVRHINNPAMRRHRVETFHRDRLETQQMRMEREILRRMQEGFFRLPNGQLAFLARGGKHLLLAVTLPLYYFFYTVPKWLFPKIVHVSQKMAQTVTKMVNETLHPMMLKIASAMKGSFQLPIHKAKALFAAAMQMIAKPFQQIQLPSFEVFSKMAERMQEMGSKISALFQTVRDVGPKVREFFIYLPNRLVDFARQMGDKVVERLESFKERVQEKLRPIVQFANQVGQVIRRVAEPPLNLFKRGLERGRELVHKVTEPIKEKYRAVADVANRVREKVVEAIQSRVEKVRDWGHEVAKATENVVKNVSHNIAQAAIAMIPAPAINFFASFGTVVKEIPELLKRKKRTFVEKWNRLKMPLYRFHKRMKKLLIRGGRWLVAHLVKLPRKIWNFLLKVFAFIAELSRRIFFILRLIFAWVRVLIRYSYLIFKAAFAA